MLENLHNQIKSLVLQNKPLPTCLPTLVPTLSPKSVFPTLSLPTQQPFQPELVYVSLVVQDIQDQEYYYSYLIRKGKGEGQAEDTDVDVKILKYGYDSAALGSVDQEIYDCLMESRDIFVCVVGGFYQTQWVQQETTGQKSMPETVIMKVSGDKDFRLGQRITAVCAWNPFDKVLNFIRVTTPQQTLEHSLHYQSMASTMPINLAQTRQSLLCYLQSFTTGPQSHLLLYSLISPSPLFLNSNFSFSDILCQLVPNFCHLKITAPFKQSLFPYKDADGRLVRTPMQLGMEKCYVVVDFGGFSGEHEVKIGQEEIDNLKALKMFVEEGKTIYRWEYGESLVDHYHSGLIVKGSKLITPHYTLPPHLLHSNEPCPPALSAQTKRQFRNYIQQCQKLNSSLSEQSRKKIEEEVRFQLQTQSITKLLLEQRMQLAKLNAMSYGREHLLFEDYILAGDLLGVDHQQ